MSEALTASIDEMVRMGIPRSKAEPIARDLYPAQIVQVDQAAARRASVLEKDEQRAIRSMALALGFRVYWLSQSRATKQTPGLPDLWLSQEAIGFAGWWETKRQFGGKRSDAQEDFAGECQAARIPYGFGDRRDFAKWLTQYGFTPPPVPE